MPPRLAEQAGKRKVIHPRSLASLGQGGIAVSRLVLEVVTACGREAAIPAYNLGLTVAEPAGFLLVFSNDNLSISHAYRDQDA